MLIANVEGDELLMSTITSIGQRDYHIRYKSGATLKNNRRHDKKTLLKKMQKLGKIEGKDFNLELSLSYKSLDLAIFLLQKKLRKIEFMTQCDALNVFVGPLDGSNFRFKAAKTNPYKANRGEKPEILLQLREWLLTTYATKEMTGFEADDALGIYQKIEGDITTIAVHVDKDIMAIPGRHYNPVTDVFSEVSLLGELRLEDSKIKGNGLAFFYFQMLLGDTTDTIPNVAKGWGLVKCFKQLQACNSEHSYLVTVINTYKQEHPACWKDRLLEQADLVWICREEREKGSDYIKRRYTELEGRLLD